MLYLTLVILRVVLFLYIIEDHHTKEEEEDTILSGLNDDVFH